MSLFLTDKEYWTDELIRRAKRAKIAAEFLAANDTAALSDALIIGSSIARRLLEEGKQGHNAIEKDEYHFEADACTALNKLYESSIHLKDCWCFEGKEKPVLLGKGHFSLTYYKFFSQIIHTAPLQLWKTDNETNPHFFFASEKDSSKGENSRFYRLNWHEYSRMLHNIAEALETQSSSPKTEA